MLALILAIAVRPTGVSFSALNSPYYGVCPATLKFAGTISGAPNTAIKYVFNRTIHGVTATSAPMSATLDRSGQFHVTDSISVTGAQSGADELQLLPGGAKAAAPFVVTCAVNAAKPNTQIRTQLYLVDGKSRAKYDYPYDRSTCGTDPSKWSNKIRMYLKAAFTAEKAFMQEKDKYSQRLDDIGWDPEPSDAMCLRFDLSVGHYDGEALKAGHFLVTDQFMLGGPMYCVTSDAMLAGDPRVSTTGGPISTPAACAALPPTQ